MIGSRFLDLATANSKVPPATLYQPAFENLQQPSEKANWLRTPFFARQYPITDYYVNSRSVFRQSGVSTLVVTENKAEFTGSGWLNGKVGYSYTVKVEDNGDPGRGKDTFSIKITSNSFTYDYSGTLAGGNITVHEVKPKVNKPKDGAGVAKAKTEAKKGKGKKK